MQALRVRYPSKNAALHLHRVDRSFMIPDVCRANAVLQQQTPISDIVGFSHYGVNADVGGDPHQDKVRDTQLLQDEKEVAAIADALSRLIDEYLSFDRLDLFDAAPTLRTADQ